MGMATIKQFEDLDDWQAARALAKAIYSTSSAGEFSGISVSRIKFDGRPSPQWEILRQALNVMAIESFFNSWRWPRVQEEKSTPSFF
jgi:hypothetical protein